MKARIKETGEPLEDLIIFDSTGNQWPLDDVELIPDTHLTKEIDWEQRRFELVKAAMQGLLSTCSPGLLDKNFLAALSIDYADTVIAEYMKVGRSNENEE